MVANPALGRLKRGKLTFSCPRSRLRIWYHETGSAVPSRVSLLILHTQAESSDYGIPSASLDGVHMRGRGGKEKKWTNCVQSDIRALA